MNKSEQINELALALSNAQKKFEHARKDATNKFFSASYATLKEVIDATRDILAENGLSISQFPVSLDGKAGCENLLIHSSGQFIESTLLLAVKDQSAQGMGSAITYARRYSWASICGISSELDDDAECDRKAGTKDPTKKSAKDDVKLNPQQEAVADLRKRMAGIGDVKQVEKWMVQRAVEKNHVSAKESELDKWPIEIVDSAIKAIRENYGVMKAAFEEYLKEQAK